MSQDFFQCLVCQSLFGNLWNVEKHIKKHEHEGCDLSACCETGGQARRRGMLPIKKMTIRDCYVPVVKNQIDPAFLEQYSGLQAKEEVDVKVDMRAAEYLELGFEGDEYMDDDFDPAEDCQVDVDTKPKNRKPRAYDDHLLKDSIIERGPRKCRLKASENIKRSVAFLKLSDEPEVSSEQNEEMRLIEKLLDELSDEEDNDFHPPSYVSRIHNTTKRKRGRPFGNATSAQQVRAKKSSRVKKKRSKTDKSESGGFTCEYCQEGFLSRNELSQHMCDHHQDKIKMIICPIGPCARPCINFASLRDHLRAHSDLERKELQLLEEAKNCNYKDETYIHNTPKNGLPCKFCFEKFASFEKLRTHTKLTHEAASVFKCPCCEASVPEENGVIGFIGHLKALHPERIDPHNERLIELEKRRAKGKPFKCDVCNTMFSSKQALNSHSQKHDRIKKQQEDPSRRFSCPVCQYRFKYKDNLRRHFVLHLENNPYTCDLCNRKFNSDYNLRRHRALHFDTDLGRGQRVQCPLCPTTVSRRDKLMRHLREIHKPADLAEKNIILQEGSSSPKKRRRTKQYQSRLPHCTRVPLLPTSTPLECAKEQVVVNSAEPVKTESQNVEFTSVEEIHLVDKIILDLDGNEVHVKGEQLIPEKVSLNLTKSSVQATFPGGTIAEKGNIVQDASLSKLITTDPLFDKLFKDKPDSLQDVLTKEYNYKCGKIFSCHLCEAIFTRAWTLQLHLKTLHNQTILDKKKTEDANTKKETHKIMMMCGKCAYPAENAEDLDRHMKMAHKKPLKCSECGLGFEKKFRLQQHMQEIHTEGFRKFPCRFCSRKFTSMNYRGIHEKKVHNNSDKPVERKPCPIEGCKLRLTPSSFINHVRRHKAKLAKGNDQKTKKPECLLCGDFFTTETTLRRHIDAVHLGKPINKRPRSEAVMASGKRPSAKIVRRGPKQSGDEWFLPILEKAFGNLENGEEAEKIREDYEAAVFKDSKLQENDKEELSILGF